MAVDPISFSKLLKKTDDIYEAVVVSSKRAKQILQDRIVKQMIDENEEISEDGIIGGSLERSIVNNKVQCTYTNAARKRFPQVRMLANATELLRNKRGGDEHTGGKVRSIVREGMIIYNRIMAIELWAINLWHNFRLDFRL